MEALVLAGGKGTRLRSVVSDVPKPMAPIAGKPFLEYLLHYLRHNGIKRVVLSVGYKWETIFNHFGNLFYDVELVYSIEDSLLGTGGAIRKGLEYINGGKVLICNGDTFFNVPLQEFISNSDKRSKIVLSLKPMKNFDRYGCVETDEEGYVTEFSEKRAREVGNINGGLYLVSKDIFGSLSLPEVFSFEKFMEAERGKLRISSQIFDEYFIDIGIPEDYDRAQREMGEFF